MTYMDWSHTKRSLGALNLGRYIIAFSAYTERLNELALRFIPYRGALANEIQWEDAIHIQQA